LTSDTTWFHKFSAQLLCIRVLKERKGKLKIEELRADTGFYEENDCIARSYHTFVNFTTVLITDSLNEMKLVEIRN